MGYVYLEMVIDHRRCGHPHHFYMKTEVMVHALHMNTESQNARQMNPIFRSGLQIDNKVRNAKNV